MMLNVRVVGWIIGVKGTDRVREIKTCMSCRNSDALVKDCRIVHEAEGSSLGLRC